MKKKESRLDIIRRLAAKTATRAFRVTYIGQGKGGQSFDSSLFRINCLCGGEWKLDTSKNTNNETCPKCKREELVDLNQDSYAKFKRAGTTIKRK